MNALTIYVSPFGRIRFGSVTTNDPDVFDIGDSMERLCRSSEFGWDGMYEMCRHVKLHAIAYVHAHILREPTMLFLRKRDGRWYTYGSRGKSKEDKVAEILSLLTE